MRPQQNGNTGKLLMKMEYLFLSLKALGPKEIITTLTVKIYCVQREIHVKKAVYFCKLLAKCEILHCVGPSNLIVNSNLVSKTKVEQRT